MIAVHTYPKTLGDIADYINEPSMPELTRRFLFDQLNPDGPLSSDNILLHQCPTVSGRVSVFHSAIATFYAPSDQSGIRGMRRERIRSAPSWHGRGQRRDCAFVVTDQSQPGMRGLSVVRVKCFFSFKHDDRVYPCALVEWFEQVGRWPDRNTGMWRVKAEYHHRQRASSVIHLDTFLLGAHLLPIFGVEPLPLNFLYTDSLDAFEAYYVNKYADHHANEIAF